MKCIEINEKAQLKFQKKISPWLGLEPTKVITFVLRIIQDEFILVATLQQLDFEYMHILQYHMNDKYNFKSDNYQIYLYWSSTSTFSFVACGATLLGLLLENRKFICNFRVYISLKGFSNFLLTIKSIQKHYFTNHFQKTKNISD